MHTRRGIVEHRQPGLLIGWFDPGGAPADVYGRPPQERLSLSAVPLQVRMAAMIDDMRLGLRRAL
jgi:hypothetical protein